MRWRAGEYRPDRDTPSSIEEGDNCHQQQSLWNGREQCGPTMDNRFESRSGFFARMVADPVQLRRRSRIALLILIVLVVISQLLSGFLAGMLTALTWICAPIVAFGIGVGDAFFVRHGRQQRRILASIILSIVVVLMSCVILAGRSNGTSTMQQNVVESSLYGLLFAGIVVGLSGLIALGIGRGEDYVSRRIDRMSDEDW